MMKNLIDPRLPIAVLRAAILDTFVALSDKWIFEVCCHAQGPESVMKNLSNEFEYFIPKNLTGKYLANISFASKDPTKVHKTF